MSNSTICDLVKDAASEDSRDYELSEAAVSVAAYSWQAQLSPQPGYPRRRL